MSEVYTDSILKENQKYLIQNIKQLRDSKRFIGLSALFKYVPKGSSTAHVMITGNMHEIPVRALINVKGYIANGVSASKADAFAVVFNNHLNIPIGQAFINPDYVTGRDAYFIINGKEVAIPLDILCTLSKVKDKVSSKTEKKLKSVSIPTEAINALDVPEVRDNINNVPSAITKLFPNLNVPDIYNTIKESINEVFDYSGEVHNSIAEADKANTLIRHKMLEDILLELVQKNLNQSFQGIRDEIK